MAAEVPARTKPSNCPLPFSARMAGPGDEASYPDEDLRALLLAGQWQFVHRDGGPGPGTL